MRSPPLLLLLALIGSSASASHIHSGNWPCSWMRGRLELTNGTPSVRIWPHGTHRVLGVVNLSTPHSDVGELDTLPANVLRLIGDNDFATVWGKFYVCPVAPERAGCMRFVVVKRATSLRLAAD